MKYKIKKFSKSPEDVTIRIGTWDNKQKLGDLSDKQLRNIASWNHKSPKAKKNVRNNKISVIAPSSLVGGITGYQTGGMKGAAIGTAVGAGIGGGIVLAADRLHKKQAKAAEEVLKKRGIKLPKEVKTTEEKSKNYSESSNPDIWVEYKKIINPEISRIDGTLRYHVFFCRALDEIEEDPMNPGYYIMFDTIPGLKWKDGDYYILKSGIFGISRKLTKVSRKEALEYLRGRFCTTDDPLRLAYDQKIMGIYDKIMKL